MSLRRNSRDLANRGTVYQTHQNWSEARHMASSGKSDTSTKTGTASQNQVIRILLGDQHTDINLSAFQKSVKSATEDAKLAFYRNRMDKEQQKNAKVRWDSLSKDQKENAGLGVNNEPIDVENLMITLREASLIIMLARQWK